METPFDRELPKFKSLSQDIVAGSEKYLNEFDPWYPGFEDYMYNNFVSRDKYENLSALPDSLFLEKLSQYLVSPTGAKYASLLAFENDAKLECGKPAPKPTVRNSGAPIRFSTLYFFRFKMASIRFQHQQYVGTEEHIEAMNWVKDTIKDQDFDGVAFPMSQTYSRHGTYVNDLVL